MGKVSLDSEAIIQTAKRLSARIEERFPQSGLSMVSLMLVDLASFAQKSTAEIRRPNAKVRLMVIAAIAAVIMVIAAFFSHLEISGSGIRWTELIQSLDAAVNELVLLGAALFFVLSLESRIKRRAALTRIYELRSLAHVVDMHQLTKDPDRALRSGDATRSSPERQLTPFLLTRYLDYCSEMLSLLGKLGALYGEDSTDEVVLSAVDALEDLTTGLSGKIWQKISIISNYQH